MNGTASAWQTVRSSVTPGDELMTPGRGIPASRQRPFVISRVGPDFLVMAVGRSGFSAKVRARAFEAVMEHLRAPRATLRVAALHSNEPLEDSVDKVVREAERKNFAAGNYVAAILEHAGLVEYVMVGRQKHIRAR